MRKFNRSLLIAAAVLFGTTGVQAQETQNNGERGRPFAHLQGVWMTKVTIRDCATNAVLAGPFAGLITFQEGGTIGETGPALPNSTRSPGHGTWKRLDHNSFQEHLIFQRFDFSGILHGTQVINAKPVVARDSMSYVAADGTFEVKDLLGVTIATGCSSASGTRFL